MARNFHRLSFHAIHHIKKQPRNRCFREVFTVWGKRVSDVNTTSKKSGGIEIKVSSVDNNKSKCTLFQM